jgi:hypothetical protein
VYTMLPQPNGNSYKMTYHVPERNFLILPKLPLVEQAFDVSRASRRQRG